MLGALFLAAAWLAWLAAHRVAATPSPEWDAAERMNDLVASRQPEGANAWPIYERILHGALGIDDLLNPAGNALYDALTAHLRVEDPLRGEWDDPHWTEHRERLEQLRPLFTFFDELAAATGYARLYQQSEEFSPGPTPVFMILLPELGLMRQLARLNAVGMRAAAEAEDWDELVRRFRTGRAIGRHLSFQATLIEWLVSASIISLTHDEMIRILMERDIPAPVCEALLRAMEEIEWPAPAPGEMFEGERLFLHDALQWAYEPGEHGRPVEWALWDYAGLTWGNAPLRRDPFSSPTPLWRLLNLNPVNFFASTHGQAQRDIDDMMRDYAQQATPGADAAPFVGSAALGRVMRNPVLRLIMPSFDRAGDNLQIALTKQAALEVMLRLELHHAGAGAWPATLEEAMTPAQTKDPVSGDPFEYERIEDDAEGRPYILRGPDFYPISVRLDHWPVLNNARQPIPEEWRETGP